MIISSEQVLYAAKSILAKQKSMCSAFVKHDPQNAVYAYKCPLVQGSVGGHIRHSIDHYSRWSQAAMVARENCTEPKQILVEYDRRLRHTKVETDSKAALEALDCRINELDSMEGNFESFAPCTVNAEFEIVTDSKESGFRTFNSTIERELWFVGHHAIHHNAMIQVIINALPDSAKRKELQSMIPEYFGLAPSTFVFQNA